MQWLQDPSEINGDNLNTARCEASTYFRNKNSKNKSIRDLYRGIMSVMLGR
jgi:hypothetical protein